MKIHIYIGILIAAITFAGCKGKKSAAPKTSTKGSAEVEPEQLRPQMDTRFQERFFAAQLEKAKGNAQKAYALFEECLKIDPTSAVANYELGRMDLAILNNPGTALSRAKIAVASDPKNPWYHLLLADIYMAQAKYEPAIKSYREVARLNPDDPNTLYQIAGAQLYAGKYKEAITTYDELEKTTGPYEELSMQKHQLYEQLRQKDKAAEELEKLARAFPGEPRYWGILSQYYQKNGQADKAKWAMEQMVLADPTNGQVHLQLSEYYAAIGQDQKSFDELKLAFATTDVTIDQKLTVLLRFFTLSQSNNSFYKQAYELLYLTEKTHPLEAKAFSIHGDFLYNDGKKSEALQKYKEACRLDNSRSPIWEQVLYIETELGLYADMEKDSQTAIELFPNLPQFYYYNGVANDRLKNTSKAIESYNLGKELVFDNNPLLARFYAALGDLYHSTKEHTKSDEHYEKALKLEPTNTYVLNNYAYYLALRKTKTDKAVKMALEANALEPGNAAFEDTCAWALFQDGKYSEALPWIEKAISRAKPSAELLEHYGDILFKVGRTADALSKWKEASQISSNPTLQKKIDSKTWTE